MLSLSKFSPTGSNILIKRLPNIVGGGLILTSDSSGKTLNGTDSLRCEVIKTGPGEWLPTFQGWKREVIRIKPGDIVLVWQGYNDNELEIEGETYQIVDYSMCDAVIVNG